jgi:DNA repair protein RecO (recombination protein O)
MNKKTFTRVEAILLSSIHYGEEDRIIKAFTKHLGVLSFFAAKANNSKRRKEFFLDPLSLVEISYIENRGELFQAKEILSINPYLALRENYEQLSAGCHMAEAVEKAMLPGKPAFLIYSLLSSFLKKIPEMEDPWILAAAFRLKLLKHEGLSAIAPFCPICQIPLTTSIWANGQLYCLQDGPAHGIVQDELETNLWLLLTHGKSFRSLKNIVIPKSFLDKVVTAFSLSLQQ